MEKENDSKKWNSRKTWSGQFLKQQKEIKKLKKKPTKKLTKMKFVGVIFEPEKYKTGEAEINDALSNGFEVIRDFQTGSGIVHDPRKVGKQSGERKNGTSKNCICRFGKKVSNRDTPRYFFRICDVSSGKLFRPTRICRINNRLQSLNFDSDRNHVYHDLTDPQICHSKMV